MTDPKQTLLERLQALRAQTAQQDSVQRTGLWSADPHVYGPGKIHIVNVENTVKTMCGKWINKIPGKFVSGSATCQVCINAVENLKERRARQERWRNEGRSFEREKELRRLKRKEEYKAYLLTPAWREKADAVLHRAGGMCEGCGKKRATQVHHLTYEHIFKEFLWELQAVCRDCHERWHEINE